MGGEECEMSVRSSSLVTELETKLGGGGGGGGNGKGGKLIGGWGGTFTMI